MDLLEHQGKHLFRDAGIAIPRGTVASSPGAAEEAAARIGSCVVVKSQVPTGKRGKYGAIGFADTPHAAGRLAEELLGSDVGGHRVEELLVEERVDIAQELYAAVLADASSKGPLLLFSTAGGMDIEEVSAERLHRHAIDIRKGLDEPAAMAFLAGTDLDEPARPVVARSLVALYGLYRAADAALVEINPLVLTGSGDVVALDSKVSLDPAALPRQGDLVGSLASVPDPGGTDLERRGRDLGFTFIELDGDVGVLANGAGLTMTTLDVVGHYGGRPANFLEIGGDAYTKATPALRLVLDNPRVRSLLVNFCGAFARTDVMTAGVVGALEELRPRVPVFFTIHGTGEEEAIRLVRTRLGIEPYDLMDDAVKAAVAAARGVA